MSDTIMAECYFFLHAALTGVILSAIYDVFRILRRVRCHGWFWIAVEDLFYWIGSALYIFSVLMQGNNGIIRWFFVLGILLGMLVYNMTLSQHLVGALSKVIKKILDIVEIALKTVLKPITFLCIKTKKIFQKSGKKVKKALKNCCKTIRIGISRK